MGNSQSNQKATGKIPKIIHFIWAGGLKLLPSKSMEMISLWANANPNFTIYLWIDNQTAPKSFKRDKQTFNTLEDFYLKKFSSEPYQVKQIKICDIGTYLKGSNPFSHFIYPIIRYEIDKLRPNYGASSDLIRYLVLYQYGGAYFDSDVKPNPNFNLEASGIFKDGQTGPRIYLDDRSQGTNAVGNDAFICTLRHPFMMKILERAQENYQLKTDDKPLVQRISLAYLANDLWFFRNATIITTGPMLINGLFFEMPEAFSMDAMELITPYHSMRIENNDIENSLTLREFGENTGNWMDVPIAVRSLEMALPAVCNTIVFEAIHYRILRLEDHINELAIAANMERAQALSQLLEILSVPRMNKIIMDYVEIVVESKDEAIKDYYQQHGLGQKTQELFWNTLSKEDFDELTQRAHDGIKYTAANSEGKGKEIAGLSYQEVPGDGHCLFHAVALYTGQTQEALREMVATHLADNLDSFREFITLPPGETIENYIEAVRSGKEWAAAIEIEVLMRVLQRSIVVITWDGAIRNHQDIARFADDPIFVSYNGVTHYDALLLDNVRRPQEIIDELTRPADRLLELMRHRMVAPPPANTNVATSDNSSNESLASSSQGPDQSHSDAQEDTFSAKIGRP